MRKKFPTEWQLVVFYIPVTKIITRPAILGIKSDNAIVKSVLFRHSAFSPKVNKMNRARGLRVGMFFNSKKRVLLP